MNRLILLLTAAAALSGCATTRQKTTPPPPAPDVVVIKRPIERARAAQVKATAQVDTARTAVQAVVAKVQEIQPTAQQAPVVQEIQRGLAVVDTQLADAREQLRSAVDSLAEATLRADDLQGQVNTLADAVVTARAETQKAEERLAKETNAHKKTAAAYHRLKFFVSLVAAIIAGLIATRFVPKTNIWWQIGAPIAVAAAAFIAAWLIL